MIVRETMKKIKTESLDIFLMRIISICHRKNSYSESPNSRTCLTLEESSELITGSDFQ